MRGKYNQYCITALPEEIWYCKISKEMSSLYFGKHAKASYDDLFTFGNFFQGFLLK
jgi:hypothetical protein